MNQEPKNPKTFEEALHEIERIVSAMERGDLALEDSIQGFEKGMKLIQECNQKLLSAEKTIKILERNLSGHWEEKDFEAHEKQDGSESTSAFNKKLKPARPKAVKSPAEANTPGIDIPEDATRENDSPTPLELF